MLKVASKFMTPTLDFQSHSRPGGRNSRALKIWGSLFSSFGVLGALRGLRGLRGLSGS